MTALDYALIGVIVVSLGLGIWRGLVRETMSLAGWVIAFLTANLVAAPLADVLPKAIAREEWRLLIAYVLVFIAVLAVTTLAAVLLARVVKAAGLGNLDRTLGAFFGLARGIVLLVACTIAAGLTTLPRQPLWQRSVGAGMLERTVVQLKPWLPPALAGRLKYN